MEKLLLEEIYNRPELNEVDNLFAEIMKYCPSEDFKNPVIKKNLIKIATIMKKVFNVDCKIFLHPALNSYITFGMRIFPSYEEMKNQIVDAIEKPKIGFNLISCNNVSIEIDGVFLNEMAKEKRSPREMTAVLIHEIGHKVYVRIQRDIYSKEYDMIESNKVSVRVNRAKFIRSILPDTNPITTFANVLMAFMGTSSITELLRIRFYSEREIHSDSLAVSYGYGKEMFSVLTVLQKKSSSEYVSTSKKILDWFEKNMNFYYLRRKGVIEFLKREYNKSDSPIEKENIKKLLNDLIKTQNKDFNERDSKVISESLNEFFKSIT